MNLTSYNPESFQPDSNAVLDSTALRPYPTVYFAPYSYGNTQGIVVASEGNISFFMIENMSDQATMKKIGDSHINFKADGIQNFGSRVIIYGRHQFILVDMERNQIEENTG